MTTKRFGWTLITGSAAEGVSDYFSELDMTVYYEGALSSEAELARSLALDMFARWRGLESDGQFRFTPPTHALLAFQQALLELAQEGGEGERRAF